MYQQIKYKLTLVMLCAVFFITAGVQKAHAQYSDVSVSYQDFYDDLAPYGIWVDDAQYGYVWVPNVTSDFRPYYTNGYWLMTQYGNTWVSNYQWGWIPFHYGRWTYDTYYGWLWIPGMDWGPAWVSWRYGNGCYGWAPLSPDYAFGSVYGGYYCPSDWWVFIPPQYMYTGSYYHYWNGPRGNETIINNTTVVDNTYVNNNVTYVAGPRPTDVEGITHQPVTIYKLTSSTNPNAVRVHKNTNVVKMFRPMEVKQVQDNGTRPAPAHVVKATQPISKPQMQQSVGQGNTSSFKNDVPQQQKAETAPSSIHFNEPAKPAQSTPSTQNRQYEWDVKRPQPQTAQPRQDNVEQQRSQPQQNFSRPEPQQNVSRPQQENMSRPQAAPTPRQSAPAPARNEGGIK